MKIATPRTCVARSVRSLRLALGLLFPLAFLPALPAANGTWDGGGGNANWTTLANWTGDTAYPGATSSTTNTDIATFNTAIANTWGASGTPILIDSATFNLGGISFDTAAGNYIIGTTGGNSLYLTSGGTIQMLSTLTNASATETINAPLVIVGANGTYNFNNVENKNTSSLVIGGAISGGTAGNTVLTFDSYQGAAPNAASGVISNGSATTLSLVNSTGTWTYSGNNTYTGSTTVKAGVANFTGTYSGGGSLLVVSLPGTATTATATITGDANFSGDVAVTSTLGNNATLNLGTATSAGGALIAATSVTLAGGAVSGARLNLNDTAGNANRILDTATVTLGYGLLTLTGNATSDTTETIKSLVIGTGSSSINIVSATNRITKLAATSLTRTNNGTLTVTGTNLGSAATSSSRITFSTAPTAQLIGSGGAPSSASTGTKNFGILPWALGATSFLTYDTANGLRGLTANEVQTSITAATAPTSGQTGDNVSISAASETGITTQTINSLFLAATAAQTITGAGAGNTLTISSGGLAQTGAFTSTLSGFDTITFGNGEAVISTTAGSGTIALNSSIIITSNGGLTKSGTGTLLLGAANTFSGPTLIQAGTLQIGGTSGDLGTSASIVINGTVAGSNTATLSIARGGSLSIGSVSGGGNLMQTDATSVLTLNQSGAGNTLNTVSGISGSTLIFAGDGTGQTTINTALASAGQLIKVTSGTVNLAASRNIAVNLEIDGGIVNTRDNQTGFNSTTGTGTRTFTMSGGAFNILGTYGLSGFNSGGDATSTGYTGIFIGTQTGGILTIGNNDPTNTRFTLGNGSANTVTTYTLSGGEIDALDAGGFQIGADVGGTSTATFNLSGGKLLVAATSAIRGAQSTGAKQAFVWTGGTLATYGYIATNLTSAAGTAVSASTNTLVNGGGTLAPGDIGTVGRTGITGNYKVDPLATNAANAALAIDIGGTVAASAFQETPGSGKFDILQISSTATLGGQLDVSLVDSFAPSNANTFKILTTAANGRSGTFTNTASANGGGVRVALADGLSSFKVTYNTADVTLGGYLSDNQWTAASTSNWTTASSWSAFTPGLAGHIAKFADAPTATGPIAVNLDANETIAGIQFNSTTRSYTISSATSNGLTLDNNGSTSAISTVGTHSITVPLALNNNLAITTVGSGDSLAISGVISGSAKTLTSSGPGTLTLSGANTYTGGTAITAGTLLVNNTTGSATGTGTLAIGASATLGGTGTIHGATTLQGILAAGNAATPVGTLTFESTLALSGTASFDLAGVATGGVDYDQIALQSGGTLSSGATLSLTIGDQFLTALNTAGGTATLTLFTGAAPSGAFTSIALTGTDSGSAFGQTITGTSGLNYTYNGDGTLTVMASAIPEPATWTALAGLLALLATLALRRRPSRLRLA